MRLRDILLWKIRKILYKLVK